MSGKPVTSEKQTFCTGISSNGSDDSPYSWTEKPFHPYTDRYKNAPVCRTIPRSKAATNLVTHNIFTCCSLHGNIPLINHIWSYLYRYARCASQPCRTKRYPISRHYERREDSYINTGKTLIPSFWPLAFRSLMYHWSILNVI